MNMLKKSPEHMIDVLFALVTLCLFTVSVLLALVTGAKVYRGISNDMQAHYTDTTAVSYLVQKVRHYEQRGAISVGMLGDCNALLLEETIGGTDYVTAIYYYDGAIRELFTEKGNPLGPESGFVILPSRNAKFVLNDDLLTISCCGSRENTVTLCLRCTRQEELQ